MERKDLEQRLKRMQRVPHPDSLDSRMESLFEVTGQGLEQRLETIRRIPAPESLDQRLEHLFDHAAERPVNRRPWRLPVWAAAAAGLLLVASFLIRGGAGPEPVVVEITPDGQLEQFLLGGEPSSTTVDMGIFTQGDCTVETVWPADAPGWDRTNGGNES